MPVLKEFGKPTPTEVNNFNSVADDCIKLAKGLKTLNGILEKDAYITKIDAGIILIDNITALKADLEADKAILEA